MTLREEDLKIEVHRHNGNLGGMRVAESDVTVRITYLPTGQTVSATARSGLEAKKLALSELQKNVEL